MTSLDHSDRPWTPPPPDPTKLVVRYGDSVVKDFARGHSFPGILRELIQNEYDAGGASLEIDFGSDALRVRGTGAVISPDGWKRLSVVMGTGRVTGSENEEVEAKKNGIGSKNFGLRSLFVFGDTIHIRSGGLAGVLDLRAGASLEPEPDPGSQSAPGAEIFVPYRTARFGSLEVFTREVEERALEGIAASLGASLLKLAVPGAPKSVERLTLRSARLGRVLEWSQRATPVRCRLRGVRAMRRTVRITDSHADERAEQEIEFSRSLRIPMDHRGRDVPGYFLRPGGRVVVAVSLATQRGRLQPGAIGAWYYPIGVTGQSTGTGITVSAPFEMNDDRTAIVPAAMSTWNRWLLDEAASLAVDLLTRDWWQRFGADAYVAAWPSDLGRATESHFATAVRDHLVREPCWPAQAPRGAATFRPATELVVPETPALGGFLSADRYPPEAATRRPGFSAVLTAAGAKTFGLPSLVRLRCAGKDGASELATRLPPGAANFFYASFGSMLAEPDRQTRFAGALDSFRHLPEPVRADLAGTRSTLSAAGTLEPAKELQRVPAEIADATLVPARNRLHPVLLGSRTFARIAQPYDPLKWVKGLAVRITSGRASEDERVALYAFLRQKRGRFPAHVLSVLRAAPVLRDAADAWAAPQDLVLRRTPGRRDFAPVLRLPHHEVEADRELVRALRIRHRLAARDVVALAHWVAEDESRAEDFERILLAYRRLLVPQTIRSLGEIAFLRSRQEGLACPRALYVDSPRLRACLGDDAPYVDSALPPSHLVRLGCRTDPRTDDILSHLRELGRLGRAPAAPETLYPELMAALQRERRPPAYSDQPVLWTDTGWARPEEVVLRTGSLRLPPGSIPRPMSGSPTLLDAYRRLGASPSPAARHWRSLLRWLAAQHPRGDVVPRQHVVLARVAYGALGPAGGEFAPGDAILLGRDGRLYPLEAAARRRFLLDDHPRLAAAIEAAGLPYVFAGVAEADTIRFLMAVGVKPLSDVVGAPRWKATGDRLPPPRLRTGEILARLHHPAFSSALTAFVTQRVLRTGRGREVGVQSLGRGLRRMESLRFVQELTAVYRLGGKSVEVVSRVHVEGGQVLLSGVRGEREVLALLAQVIARELPGRDPAEWADAVLRLLQCDDADEMREYLADRGVSWTPPRASRAEGTPGRDELSEALAEQLGFEVPPRPDPPEEPSPGPPTPEGPKPALAPAPLPPLDEVQPVWEEPAGRPVEGRPVGKGGGGGRGGHTPPRDDVQDRRIGERGEELVYLRERARVRAAGLPENQVVWVSRNDPMADHDIRSVGEDGRTIWIEVKATTTRDGRFRWSRPEIVLATRKRERYLLYRVYAADSVRPVIKVFPNPASLLLDGRLWLDVAVLQAEVEGA